MWAFREECITARLRRREKARLLTIQRKKKKSSRNGSEAWGTYRKMEVLSKMTEFEALTIVFITFLALAPI